MTEAGELFAAGVLIFAVVVKGIELVILSSLFNTEIAKQEIPEPERKKIEKAATDFDTHILTYKETV